MAATKIGGLLGTLFRRQTPNPTNWTPQQGPGPVQPGYGIPQSTLLPQNRLKPMPGSGNVGATFGAA